MWWSIFSQYFLETKIFLKNFYVKKN
jgi:hypothetical protein